MFTRVAHFFVSSAILWRHTFEKQNTDNQLTGTEIDMWPVLEQVCLVMLITFDNSKTQRRSLFYASVRLMALQQHQNRNDSDDESKRIGVVTHRLALWNLIPSYLHVCFHAVLWTMFAKMFSIWMFFFFVAVCSNRNMVYFRVINLLFVSNDGFCRFSPTGKLLKRDHNPTILI